MDTVFNAENVRMLVLLVFGFCGYLLIRSRMKGLETSLGKRIDALDHKIDGVDTSLSKKIDGVEIFLDKRIDALGYKIDSVDTSVNHKIDYLESSLLKMMDEKIVASNKNLYTKLKTNDFKYLSDTIEALTFTLEKNKFLTIEDRKYIDDRLDK